MLLGLRPGSDRNQIASEAFELALKEMEDRLPSASSQDGSEPQFLDAAMLSCGVACLAPEGVTPPADSLRLSFHGTARLVNTA